LTTSDPVLFSAESAEPSATRAFLFKEILCRSGCHMTDPAVRPALGHPGLPRVLNKGMD
jgi:hypothetical protein